MRGLVRAPAVAGLSVPSVLGVRDFRCILRAGAVRQLSPLHGDDLSRLSHPRGPLQVSRLYDSHHRDFDRRRSLGPPRTADDPLAVHDLPDVESLALHGTKLWTRHDVRAAWRRATLAS